MHVLGLDIGTQGARAIICNAEGKVMAQAAESFADSSTNPLLSPGYAEQHPALWWDAAALCLHKVVDELHVQGFAADTIVAISVDSTSGTIVPLDSAGSALRPAIMYNDTRAVDEAEECNLSGSDLTEKLGYKFASSFALPKILWVMKNEPQIFEQTACFAHAADYIVGKLTTNFRISDTSNALKTGYDLIENKWPEFISAKLFIPNDKLPQVVNPGFLRAD